MIELYTDATPNGWKISVLLEELEIEYVAHHVDIMNGHQKEDWFQKISPNGRIPAIIDKNNGDLSIFESGAIMVYLARSEGALLPTDPAGEARVMQWLMFQMAGVGPMMGQSNIFYRYFPEKIPSVIERYHNECRRLFEVLDKQLEGKEFLCDVYSIADIANWSWIRIHFWGGTSIEGLNNLKQWMELLESRPACQRGVKVPHEIDFEAVKKDLESENSAVRNLVTQ